jgi:hypothetical protein
MKKPINGVVMIFTIIIIFVSGPISLLAQNQTAGFTKRDPINPILTLKDIAYFSVLPLRKIVDQDTLEETDVSKLITGEIFKGLNTLAKSNIHWSINEPGHTLPDDDAAFKELIHATFNSQLTGIDNISTVIKNIMEKHRIDIIITGLYFEDVQNSLTTVRLLVYVKKSQKIVMKNFQFKKGELVIDDPTAKRKTLHRSARYQISHFFSQVPEFQVNETVVKLLEETKTKKLPKLYVTNLSFLNARTKEIDSQSEVTQLLNGPAMETINKELLNAGKKWKRHILFNKTGHRISNTKENVDKLVNITFDTDPNLKTQDKLNKIINEAMVPNKVDIIVTGQYVENKNNKSITVWPIIIFKTPKKIFAHSFFFAIDKLVCEDPDIKKKILCREAAEKIYNKIRKFLDPLKI